MASAESDRRMAGFVTQQGSRQDRERLTLVALDQARPEAERLDEGRWQAWMAKGRAHDLRVSARATAAVRWVTVAALLAVAALWSEVAPYEVILRSVIVLGAVVVTLHSIGNKRGEIAALFAACAWIYNPVVPVFTFSGDWQRAVVLATAVPFAVLLVPHKVSKT